MSGPTTERQQPWDSLPEATREKACEATAEALGGALDCLRAWSAWSWGTMSDRDFREVTSDPDRVAEIAAAAVNAAGPDPMDLQELSDALSQAVDIAHDALAAYRQSATPAQAKWRCPGCNTDLPNEHADGCILQALEQAGMCSDPDTTDALDKLLEDTPAQASAQAVMPKVYRSGDFSCEGGGVPVCLAKDVKALFTQAQAAEPVAISYHRDDEGHEAFEAYAKIVASISKKDLPRLANLIAHGAKATLGAGCVVLTRRDWEHMQIIPLAAPHPSEPAGRVPLTEEQIEAALDTAGIGHQRGEDIVRRPWWLTCGSTDIRKFVRAVEAAHNIPAPGALNGDVCA